MGVGCFGGPRRDRGTNQGTETYLTREKGVSSVTATQHASEMSGQGDDGLDLTKGMVMSIHELENSRVTKWPPWLSSHPEQDRSQQGEKRGSEAAWHSRPYQNCKV